MLARILVLLLLAFTSHAAAAETEGSFAGTGDIALHYRIYAANAAKGAVVLINGYSETYLMYEELVRDLNDAGYNVYTYDHRGQGLSARLIGDREVGYVKDFEDYVSDFDRFMVAIVKPREPEPPALISHSTGGLISAFYAARHPRAFRRLIFSAPFFEINAGWAPEWLTRLLVRGFCQIGRCESYALSQGDFDPAKYQFEDNRLTHSRPRFERLKTMVWNNPNLLIRGASNGWLRETIEASRQIPALAGSLKMPILLLQAGDDHYVKPGRQDEFCAHTACRKLVLKDSFHEILLEDDKIRGEALDAIQEFLNQP